MLPPVNPLNRREFLARTGNGFGLLALVHLLQGQAKASASDRGTPQAANPRAAKPPMFPVKRARPGSTLPWPCSIATSSCMFPDVEDLNDGDRNR